MNWLDYNSLQPQELNQLIVYTCYRSADLTINSLRSLETQINDVPNTKVAICENGSGADSVRRLVETIEREGWADWVMLKSIHPNRGFTGGNNAILSDALAWPTPPRYYLLLNTDTVAKAGALARLYQAMEQDTEIGVMGPRLLGPNGTTQSSCFRDFSALSEFLRAANTGAVNRLCNRAASPLAPKPDTTEYDWVSFAAALIRREVFEQVGILDEGYFLYFDDADYCRSARAARWKIGHCTTSEFIHLEGASNSVPSDKQFLRRRPEYYYASRSRYLRKYSGLPGLWAANLCWLAGRCISLPRELLGNKKPHVCEKEWRDIWIDGYA